MITRNVTQTWLQHADRDALSENCPCSRQRLGLGLAWRPLGLALNDAALSTVHWETAMLSPCCLN